MNNLCVDCKYTARNPQERNATVTFERMMQSFQYYFWLIIEVLRVYIINDKLFYPRKLKNRNL